LQYIYRMRKPLLILFLILATGILKAQSTQKDSVYTFVEMEPQFRNGDFSTFIANNIQYPAKAVQERKQGKVFVNFIIQKDGSISNATIVRSVSPEIDAEALRVVNSSPRWRPGIQNGRPVTVSYTIPITFNLDLPVQKPDTISPAKTDTSKFVAVDVAPDYPGGLSKLFQYIHSNLKYKGNATGRVLITFVVEKDGSLSDITIMKGIEAEADARCLKVMQNCPKWNPGMQNNRPVRVQYTIPITFE
jgi:TonB family protein